MSRIQKIASVVAVTTAAIAVLSVAPASAQVFAGVSLKVSHEEVAPDGYAQVKITVTEPKPISTGRGRFAALGFDRIDGIAVASPADDAYAVAILKGNVVTLAVNSPSGTYGTQTDDYPILTITGHVPANTPMGTVFPMPLDADALTLLDPTGTPYPLDIADGEVVVAPAVSVSDVEPGSSIVSPGDVISVFGDRFTPQTKVRLLHALVSDTRFVSESQIDVIPAETVEMHGMGIRVDNKDNTRAKYFSYQRTKRLGTSTDAVLQSVIPIFPGTSSFDATVPLSSGTMGLALQNVDGPVALAVVDLVSASGATLASQVVAVPQNRYVVRSVRELFGNRTTQAARVRVRSVGPLQVMGVSVAADGSATPVVPR